MTTLPALFPPTLMSKNTCACITQVKRLHGLTFPVSLLSAQHRTARPQAVSFDIMATQNKASIAYFSAANVTLTKHAPRGFWQSKMRAWQFALRPKIVERTCRGEVTLGSVLGVGCSSVGCGSWQRRLIYGLQSWSVKNYPLKIKPLNLVNTSFYRPENDFSMESPRVPIASVPRGHYPFQSTASSVRRRCSCF